jgi:hypothetical protein
VILQANCVIMSEFCDVTKFYNVAKFWNMSNFRDIPKSGFKSKYSTTAYCHFILHESCNKTKIFICVLVPFTVQVTLLNKLIRDESIMCLCKQ